MATFGLIEYEQACAEVRAVYDDLMKTRNTNRINNFWKAIAHDPALLRRSWQSLKEVMAPGALDALTKEMIYLAVSVTNQCAYCIASHTAAARKAGMTEQMFAELMAVIGLANQNNRLVSGYQVEIDEAFRPATAPGSGGSASQGSLQPLDLGVQGAAVEGDQGEQVHPQDQGNDGADRAV